MVSKQTFPVSNWVQPVVLLIFEVLLLFCSACVASSGSNSQLQYCWIGTEDDLSGWKNLSCATGKTSLGNAYSIKNVPNADSSNLSGNESTTPGGHYCMAFKHSVITKSDEGGEDSTAQTYNVLYGCDTYNVCEGKQMLQGYITTFNGQPGTLYCCDSDNNCNTRGIQKVRQHQHTCYKAETDTTSGIVHGDIEVEFCPTPDTWCLRQVKKIDRDGALNSLSEEYRCDDTNLCNRTNLTNGKQSACTVLMDTGTQIETNLCCCREDNCYVPGWLEDGKMDTSNSGATLVQNTWQRAVLISIGVAVGILVVAVAIFIVRRSMINKRKSESPKHYGGMEYKTVTADGDDGDNVKILPAT